MRYRQKMSRGHSRKVFRAGASRTHPRNNAGRGMRGGIRF